MYYKLKTRKFKESYNNNIDIKIKDIKKILRENIAECPFSTFPYIFGSNSKQSSMRSQGNCVAMTMYFQNKSIMASNSSTFFASLILFPKS